MDIDKFIKELPTDEKIMGEDFKYHLPFSYLQREKIRIREAMKQFPPGTDMFEFLYVAQAGVGYALDPWICGSPLRTALISGNVLIDRWSQDKAQDSQDC